MREAGDGGRSLAPAAEPCPGQRAECRHRADGREVRLETEPGDYIFVPPYVPHREENPGGQEAVVIIARSSQEGIVINLDSLWPDGRPVG